MNRWSSFLRVEDEEDFNPPPDVLEDIAETLIGRPAPRAAAEGIALMQSRLARLRSDLEHFLDADSQDRVAEIRKEIHDTELRLAEYRTQQGGRN